MNEDALGVLKRMEKMRIFSQWVFAAKHGGPRNKRILIRDLGTVYEKAGIEKEGKWHLLRRTFATHLLKSGVGIESVSKLLGHSEIQTTVKSYLNITDETHKAVDRLNFKVNSD